MSPRLNAPVRLVASADIKQIAMPKVVGKAASDVARCSMYLSGGNASAGLFPAVYGAFNISRDGVHWEIEDTVFDPGPGNLSSTQGGGPAQILAMAYGNGVVVAVGRSSFADGLVSTSRDGVHWTDIAASTFNSGPAGSISGVQWFQDVAFDGKQFLLAAFTKTPEDSMVVYASPDGLNWTLISIDGPGLGTGTLDAFVPACIGRGKWDFGSGIGVRDAWLVFWVADFLGGFSMVGVNAYTAPFDWASGYRTSHQFNVQSFNYIGGDPGSPYVGSAVRRAVWNGSLWVASMDYITPSHISTGAIWTSPNGYTWTLRRTVYDTDVDIPPNHYAGGIEDLLWLDDHFLAMGSAPFFSSAPTFATSRDGISWTPYAVFDDKIGLIRMARAGSTIVAGGFADRSVLPDPPGSHTTTIYTVSRDLGATWGPPTFDVDLNHNAGITALVAVQGACSGNPQKIASNVRLLPKGGRG